MVSTKFLKAATNSTPFIFMFIHFSFDRMKLFMIESESLLERKFRGAPEKRLLSGKKLLTAEIDLGKLSVWLQRRF
jgi:hypothetical protein